MLNEELLELAQEEYLRQLQEYLTNPIKKPEPNLKELIEKYLIDKKKQEIMNNN